MSIPALSPTQAPAVFKDALAFHQRGQFDQAQARYEAILQALPQHYQSLHLLGVLAMQTGDFPRAVALIEQAIAVFPSDPNFHTNHGNALKALGQLDAALAAYDRALALKPNDAQAHSNRGVMLQVLGRLEDALASYDKAIAFQPDFAQAHCNRGVALGALRQLEAAAASYARATAIAPHYADAHFKQGVALQELGRMAQAVACYDRVIALQANNDSAHFNRGFALVELKQHEAAIASYDRAIAINPALAPAHCNRGVALQALRQWDAAIASFDQAIALQPDDTDAYVNRGAALHGAGRLQDAIASYDCALGLQPNAVNALTNKGVALNALNQLDAAMACYDHAIRIQPDYAQVHFYKSLLLLLQGEFALGWDEYTWFWKTANGASRLRTWDAPAWNGESLHGKTILLHNEQGLGDMIQFCRFAKQVAQLGARVVLEAPESLLGVLQGLEGVAQWVKKGDAIPAVDYQCVLLALPRLLQTNATNMAIAPAYLHPDASKVAQWTAALGTKTKPRIGLVWSGSSEHMNDANRSMPLATLTPFLPTHCEYVSLQKELRPTDEATLQSHGGIRHFGAELRDFTDTAALCALMDIVISVDTSVAHLSGALGKPTWIMLPLVPDWRWLLEQEGSPWYPSVTLLRQQAYGDWGSVLTQLASKLALQMAPSL